MVKVELSKDQIETIITTMDSALYWNTDTPSINNPYYQEIYDALRAALETSENNTHPAKSRFDNIEVR